MSGNVHIDSTDANGNLPVTLGTGLNPTDDIVGNIPEGYTPVPLAASGQILAGPGRIAGFYVNSTNAGTLKIANNTVTGSGYLSTSVITPAIGWHTYPAEMSVGGFVDIAGTALDVTFFVKLD